VRNRNSPWKRSHTIVTFKAHTGSSNYHQHLPVLSGGMEPPNKLFAEPILTKTLFYYKNEIKSSKKQRDDRASEYVLLKNIVLSFEYRSPRKIIQNITGLSCLTGTRYAFGRNYLTPNRGHKA